MYASAATPLSNESKARKTKKTEGEAEQTAQQKQEEQKQQPQFYIFAPQKSEQTTQLIATLTQIKPPQLSKEALKKLIPAFNR